LKVFGKITRILAKFSEVMACITIAAMTLLVVFQITNRIWFHLTVIWTEEMCRYIFVWSSLFASSLAIYRREHVAVTIFAEMFPDKLFVKIFNAFVHICILAFCTFMAYGSYKWCVKCANQYMLALPTWKVVWVYVALPLNFVIMFICQLEHAIHDIGKNFFGKFKDELTDDSDKGLEQGGATA